MIDRFIYLHGFASGPKSKKASIFHAEFEKRGISLTIPDLEGGDFENLTITSQLNIVRECMGDEADQRFGLIGSSMGGYLAVLLAQMRSDVAAIYLMAPAFEFVKRWQARLKLEYSDAPLNPGLIEVFHYRYNEPRKIRTSLFDDAKKLDVAAFNRDIPVRIVHGLKDESVDISASRQFVRSHPWCELVELDSDHGLLSHVDWMVGDCMAFFRVGFA